MHVAEAVLGTDLVGPALDRRSFHLDGPPAVATYQVMVMAVAAPSVNGLAFGGTHHVHVAVGGHSLKCAVHRCQPHALTLGAKSRMQVLGRHEVSDIHE